MGEFDGEGVGDTLGAYVGGRIGDEVMMISDKINEAESSPISSGATRVVSLGPLSLLAVYTEGVVNTIFTRSQSVM